MRWIAIVIWAALATPVWAQSGPEAVIAQQMKAFRDRDVAGAFAFASPMIQRQFGGPERFGMMVEQGYPMIWDNAEVQFLGLREQDGAWWQRVQITGPEGGVFLLDYKMIEAGSGWRIDGVYPVRADLSA